MWAGRCELEGVGGRLEVQAKEGGVMLMLMVMMVVVGIVVVVVALRVRAM